MHERNHHRLDLQLLQSLGHGMQTGFIEWAQHLAFVVEALVHFKAQLARHQGLVHALQAIHLRPVAPTQFQQIAKPFGGDQGAAGTLALDHGIGGNRRAVQDRIKFARLQVGFFQSVEQTHRWVVRCRGHLQYMVRPALTARKIQVGECSPDVDAHNPGHAVSLGAARPRWLFDFSVLCSDTAAQAAAFTSSREATLLTYAPTWRPMRRAAESALRASIASITR